MAVSIPSGDGNVNVYNLAKSPVATPRIFYVNGIQTQPRDHAVTAGYLSLLIERPVCGIYNATAGTSKLGFLADMAQCILDYGQNSAARLTSHRNLNKPAHVPENKIADFLSTIEQQYTVWNRATLSLFKELITYRHEQKMIIAHSQGNLVTSNALFVLEDVLGSSALQRVRVYSLASPAPAWPLGLRFTKGGGGRQENAFMNDMVALLRPHNLAKKLGVGAFQNAGDFRTHPQFGPVGAGPHAVNINIDLLNFLKSIRGDLGLPKDFSTEFLQKSAAAAERELPVN